MSDKEYLLKHLMGLVTKDLIVLYCNDGEPDGLASANSRVRNYPIGLYSIKENKFITEVSDSIEVISVEFSKHLPLSKEDIKQQMLEDRELDSIIPGSKAIPYLD